jgi:signal transduction histidine kinase
MKKKYIFALITAFVSTFLYLFITMFSNIQKGIEGQIREGFNRTQHLITQRVASQIEGMLNEAKGEILFVRNPFALIKLIKVMDSKDRKAIAFWRDGLERVYLPLLNSHSQYRSITFIDEKGDEVVRVEKDLIAIHAVAESYLKNISEDLIFKETAKLDNGQIYIERYEDVIKISTPVYRDSIKGIVVIEIAMKDIYSIVSPVKYGMDSHSMLFTDKGGLLFCSKGLTEEVHKAEIEYISKNPSGSYTEIDESHGQRDILMAISPAKVDGGNWIVAMESTADEVKGRAMEFEQQKNIVLILLILMIIVGLSYLFKIILDKARNEKSLENLNNELNIANERLKEVDKQKTEFLNIVAHDLRSPLTSIKSYIEMLFTHKDKPEISHMLDNFINVISHESIRLENLLNEYLDMAKIESGTMTFSKEPVNIGLLIEWQVEAYRGVAVEKDININPILPEDMPFVVCDEVKTSQVISNLLSNAVKFSPRSGTITVSAEKKGDYIEAYVEDSGSGIPDGYEEKIFEKFVQLQSGKEKGKKGAGLGLPIAKFIVEQQGGKMWVENKEGKGAKFLFTLPLKNP